MKRVIRRLWPLAFAACLVGLPAVAAAQDEAPAEAAAEEGGSGSPEYGYVATAFLAAFTIFVLCKSSRR